MRKKQYEKMLQEIKDAVYDMISNKTAVNTKTLSDLLENYQQGVYHNQFLKFMIKEFDKSKKYICFIKIPEDSKNFSNFSRMELMMVLKDLGIWTFFHHGEFDSWTMTDMDDFQKTFNNLFAGSYKIIKEKTKE